MNKKLLRLIILIFLLMTSLTAICQSEDKTPVEDILSHLENKFEVKFSYEPKILKNLKIDELDDNLSLNEALDYIKLITKLNFVRLNDRFIAIKLNTENIQYLEEVVVTNFLTKGIFKTNTGAVNVKTKAFDILPGLIEPDVLQIIQNLPGILSVDERISNINVRGGTNDQNLILYEGIRMYQSGHFFGLISAFNPYLTDDIKISKNGTSAIYGNGVSSTFEINNTNDISNNLNGGIGTNLLNVDGFARIPLSKKTEVQLSARRSFTDLFASATYDSYFERIFSDSQLNAANNNNRLFALNERFLFYDFNLKFLYDINNSSNLRVNLLNIYNNLDYNQTFTNSSNNFQETRSSLNQVSYGASFNYSKAFKNNMFGSVEAYYSNYDLDAQNNDISNAQSLQQENKVEDYGLRFDISKRTNDNTTVRSGYQFNEVVVTNLENVLNPDFTSLTKEIVRTHAIFGETEHFSESRNTYLRLGARISYFEKLKELVLEPRFAFNQKLTDAFRLEILGELKSQTISQIIDLQQDFLGIEKRRWQLSNGEDLPLIKSQQISLGLSYNKNDLLVSLEGYYKNVENISARSQGFQNQFQFSNDIGSFTITGIDFLINRRFNNLSTWFSYTLSNNDYIFENLNNSSKFPNVVDLTHAANLSLNYNHKNLKVGLAVNWHSGRPYTSPAENQENNNFITYDRPNNARLDDYFRTDISAIYSFKISNKIKAEAGASIWNIFNQNNIINRYYNLDYGTINEIDNKALDFTPNLSFRIKF